MVGYLKQITSAGKDDNIDTNGYAALTLKVLVTTHDALRHS